MHSRMMNDIHYSFICRYELRDTIYIGSNYRYAEGQGRARPGQTMTQANWTGGDRYHNWWRAQPLVQIVTVCKPMRKTVYIEVFWMPAWSQGRTVTYSIERWFYQSWNHPPRTTRVLVNSVRSDIDLRILMRSRSMGCMKWSHENRHTQIQSQRQIPSSSLIAQLTDQTALLAIRPASHLVIHLVQVSVAQFGASLDGSEDPTKHIPKFHSFPLCLSLSFFACALNSLGTSIHVFTLLLTLLPSCPASCLNSPFIETLPVYVSHPSLFLPRHPKGPSWGNSCWAAGRQLLRLAHLDRGSARDSLVTWL